MIYQQNQQLFQYCITDNTAKNKTMSKNSQVIVNNTIQHILLSVWNGVAQSIISNKLALNAAHLEIIQCIQSYISNATQNKQIIVKMVEDKDPKSIVIDNCAYGELEKQVKKKQNKHSSRKISIAQSVNRTRSNKFTQQNSPQKTSFYINKHNQQKINTNNQVITLPQTQDKYLINDPQQDNCRNIIFRNQKQVNDMKKLIQQRLKQRQQNSSRNKKLLKDLKKYTYDYDGKMFGVGSSEVPQKMLKIQKQDGEQSITSPEFKQPQLKTIQTQKAKVRQSRNKDQQIDKNAPKFDQNRPESLVDMFAEQSKLAEGIKIIGQKGKQRLVKQHRRRKLSGIKQYRLNQFQGLTKDRKFIDFKRSKADYSTTIDVNKSNSINSYNPQTHKNLESLPQKYSTNPIPRQKLNSGTTSQVSLILKKQKQQTSSILPPIQSTYLKKSNKIQLKRLSIQQSSRTLNQSGFQSKKSKRSSIKIDHEQLYFQNFTNNNMLK